LALSDEDVSEILRIIDSSQLDELEIETPSFSLYVSRKPGPAPGPGRDRSSGPGPGRNRSSASPGPPQPLDAPAPPAQTAPAHMPAGALPATASSEIEAPMLGTFYRTESPAHPPFVEVGDRVEPGSVVCLIEVMKLMNHIQAGVSGTIVEVLAQSGELVEFGQPLFRVALERE
jgi:acetyl-CoA carboxylase biotin carboxyl carrier protein